MDLVAPVSAAVVGSSHVLWADRARRADPDSYELAGIPIIFKGIRGGGLRELKENKVDFLLLDPSIIFLQIGGNDLDDGHNVDPSDLGASILQFAKDLIEDLTNSVKLVMVGQQLKRLHWRNYTQQQGNLRVAQLNNYLRSAFASNRHLYFWRHKGLWDPESSIWLDGVHYNDKGTHELLLSFKAAIHLGVRRLDTKLREVIG